ncbi:MAG: Gp37 family protein [Chloroherpetonaceae bacterium]|nr:Gp37 family protein [Chloroherpetonaceae bacterium]
MWDGDPVSLLNDIVSALTGLNYEIILFPDANDYTLSHPSGALLLSYDGSEFDELQSSQKIGVRVTAKVAITIQSIGLQDSSNGVYAIFSQVREKIFGRTYLKGYWIPTGERVVTWQNGLWISQMIFQIQLNLYKT